MKKIFLLALFASSAVIAFAQLTGKSTITVLNNNNDKIAGATVYLLNTNHTIVSDSNGVANFNSLPYGTYLAEVSATGYATKTINLQINNHQVHQEVTLVTRVLSLDEVVVNSQKREMLQHKTPVSLSVLSNQKVEDQRLWNIKDVTTVVPNLYSNHSGDARNVTSIRGIATTSYEPAVVTYVDGVSQFTLDSYIPQLWDVERVEVLRGPQGTLYGRSAMGGVINIITQQPSNRTRTSVEFTTGNHGLNRLTASIKTPLVKDKLFFGTALLATQSNGFYYNEFLQENFDKQHAIGSNSYLNFVTDKNWKLTANFKQLANRNKGAFTLAPSFTDAFEKPFIVNQNAATKLIDNTINSSLSASYSGSTLNFSSQTAYQTNYRIYEDPIDGDFSPIDAITIINNYGKDWNKVKVLTQEFRFSSPANELNPLKWNAGTFLFHQNIPTKQATHFGDDAGLLGSPETNYSIINTTTGKNNGLALFGRIAYQFSDKIELTGGLRYDLQKNNLQVLGQYQPDASPVPVFDVQPDTSASTQFHALSPTVILSLYPTKNNTVFASYNSGFRSGGLTQLSMDPTQPPLFAYKPEYSNNFEIGSKNVFAANKLHLNATLFYSTVKDAQVPTLVLPQAITITKNTGGLTSKGLELELAALLVKGLEINYNFGYTHARYTSLKIAGNGTETDLKGNKQIFTPEYTSFLSAQYKHLLSEKRNSFLFARGEWSYLGETFFDVGNSIRQRPYQLFNASVGAALRPVELRVWLRNITNKKYVGYAYDFGATHLGDPFTWGVSAKFEF